MTLSLYMTDASPPVRAVLMITAAIGLKLDLIPLDLMKGEHLTPDFLKMNPQHTIPTLVDDDFIVWDSHAVSAYLLAKYANGSTLLPKDLQQRAIVDQRLHFDSGVLFPNVRNLVLSVLRAGKTSVDQELKDSVNQGYDFLNKFLEDKEWIAGDAITMADYSIISTVSSLNAAVPVDSSKFAGLDKWMKKMENQPAYEANKKGLAIFEAMCKNLS